MPMCKFCIKSIYSVIVWYLDDLDSLHSFFPNPFTREESISPVSILSSKTFPCHCSFLATHSKTLGITGAICFFHGSRNEQGREELSGPGGLGHVCPLLFCPSIQQSLRYLHQHQLKIKLCLWNGRKLVWGWGIGKMERSGLVIRKFHYAKQNPCQSRIWSYGRLCIETSLLYYTQKYIVRSRNIDLFFTS